MKKTDEKKNFIAAIDSSYIRDAQMYDAETPDGLDEDNWREIQCRPGASCINSGSDNCLLW